MRTLTINRVRALAGFGITYFYYVGVDQEEFIRRINEEKNPAAVHQYDTNGLRNGQSARVEITEEATTIFAAGLSENSGLITPVYEIPAGTEDITWNIITTYNGYNYLTLTMQPA